MHIINPYRYAGGDYTPLSMTYDGTSGRYETTTGTSTGNANTFVGRIKTSSFTGGLKDVFNSQPTNRFTVEVINSDHAQVDARNKLYCVAFNSSSAQILQIISDVVVADGAYHDIFVSYDATAGTAIMYVDGVDALDTGHTWHILNTGTMPTSSGASIETFGCAGTATRTKFWPGEMGHCGFAYRYLTNPTDFATASGPKQIDESGWTEWGSQPEYWADDGQLDSNAGSSANLTKIATITGPA